MQEQRDIKAKMKRMQEKLEQNEVAIQRLKRRPEYRRHQRAERFREGECLQMNGKRAKE